MERGEAPLRWKRSGPRADAGDATHAGTTTGRGDNGRGTGECPEVLTPRARVTRVRYRLPPWVPHPGRVAPTVGGGAPGVPAMRAMRPP